MDGFAQAQKGKTMDDYISRQAVVECVYEALRTPPLKGVLTDTMSLAISMVNNLPSAEPEPLTDKEQRIFLAAMAREEKVCKEADRNYTRAPYEESLMSICKSIKRKVKDALWGI